MLLSGPSTHCCVFSLLSNFSVGGPSSTIYKQINKYLGTHISADLSWSSNTSAAITKAQQRLHFLLPLKNTQEKQLGWDAAGDLLPTLHWEHVYILHLSSKDHRPPSPLPARHQQLTVPEQSIQNIIKETSHPGHHQFNLLPSGRRYRCMKSRTNRLKNSFVPKAITLLNTHMNTH